MNLFKDIAYLIENYGSSFLNGLLYTLILAFLGTFIGLLFGMGLALLRNIKVTVKDSLIVKILKIIFSRVALVYIEIFRGTPMMVQAMIIYFGGYAMGIMWNTLVCGIIIISLNTAAYMAEIVRSGINSVDKGQVEAALSLGMSPFKTMLYVVFPQALKNAIPTIGNELIVNIKDSSVLNVITVSELFMIGKVAASNTYKTIAAYIIVALIYLTLTIIFGAILRLVERKLDDTTIKTARKVKLGLATYDS